MKTYIKNIFESIGEYITSVYFVILVMLLVIVSGCFLSHVLFFRSFPMDMVEWQKNIASWTLGIGWECTLLVAATNRNYLDKEWFVKAFAISSAVLLLFFIDAFNESLMLDWVKCLQKYFAALLIGVINYTYTELFYRKWTDHVNRSEHSKYELELKEAHLHITSLKDMVRSLQVELKKAEIRASRNPTNKAILEQELIELNQV